MAMMGYSTLPRSPELDWGLRIGVGSYPFTKDTVDIVSDLINRALRKY